MAKCAKDINEQSPWQELTPGGEIYEGGTACMTITGEWRANIPVWDPAEVQAVSAVRAVLPGRLHPGNGRQARRI